MQIIIHMTFINAILTKFLPVLPMLSTKKFGKQKGL